MPGQDSVGGYGLGIGICARQKRTLSFEVVAMFVYNGMISLGDRAGRRGVLPPPTALATPPAHWRSSMSTIITQFGQHAHPDPHRGPAAARRRQDRLASATVDDMESALAFLSMIDPEAFEIAFTAA